MGGNSIKTVPISRINLETYNALKNKITKDISQYVKLDFPYQIPNKIDFGDIDILYETNEKVNFIKLIIDLYNPVEIVPNGQVISISYLINSEYYQVDFLKCKNLNMSKFFYSYGDLGGVIGTISKKYSIGFGEGLWCNINKKLINEYSGNEIEDYTPSKIILSENPIEICKYLNLDYEKWILGFETKESIFEWVTSSSLFHKDIFLNLNILEKRKNNIRPFYKDFIEYIFNENKCKEKEPINIYNKQLEALKYFNKIELLDKLIEKNNIKNSRKKKFNGHKFMKYGFMKEDIGICILEFKKYINKKYDKVNNMDFFNIWLDCNNEEIIDFEIYNYCIDI